VELTFKPYRIECSHPFGLSRSTHDFYDIIYIYLEREGNIGRGEAAPSNHYGESFESCLRVLETISPSMVDFEHFQDFKSHIEPLTSGTRSLNAALSMAYFDLKGKQDKISLHDEYGFSGNITCPTSFTIALGDHQNLSKKIDEAESYSILKIKLGSDSDRNIINEVRKLTDKTIRVDANEGWTLEEAKDMCNWLATKNVELIEQPLKADQLHLMRELKNESPLPLIADENCIDLSDIPDLVDSFHGINIKLMKCGWCDEVPKMIRLAKELDLKVMLGCMVESSVGITAMGHFASEADYLDLDGNLLINNDPYLGIQVDGGVPLLPTGGGLGLSINMRGERAGLK